MCINRDELAISVYPDLIFWVWEDGLNRRKK